MPHNQRVLSVIPLAAIGTSAIFGLRNLPITAQYGLSSVTIFLVAALLFFLPTAYVCHYLSRKYQQGGGLYVWVKEILGEKFGFIAIWLEWINTTTSFPMMISFVVFTVLYTFSPSFATTHRVLEFFLFIVVFWLLTAINFFGIRISSRIITWSVFFGTLLPAVVISVLGLVWLVSGHHGTVTFGYNHLLPSFKLNSLTFLVAVINGFSGIQIIAFHRNETRSPNKTVPKAIMLTVVVILILSLTSTLAIASIVPHHSLIMIGGIVQTLNVLFTTFHIHWLVPVFTLLIAVGVLAEVTSWVIGPSKGIAVAAEGGYMPKSFKKTNKRGVPVTVLIVQAALSTVLASVFMFMPTVSSAYWLLSDLTAQFTLLMWLFIFISCLFLLRKEKIQNIWLKISATVGLLVTIGVALLGYLPPKIVSDHHAVWAYESFLILGLLLFIVAPLLIRFLLMKKDSLQRSYN